MPVDKSPAFLYPIKHHSVENQTKQNQRKLNTDMIYFSQDIFYHKGCTF